MEKLNTVSRYDNKKQESTNDSLFDLDFISTIITKRLKKTPTKLTTVETQWRLKVVNTLFKVLISMYGNQFSSQYDNDFAKDMWFNGLLQFTKGEISNGLEAVFNDDYVSPPNLKRFMQYCAKGSKNTTQSFPILSVKNKKRG